MLKVNIYTASSLIITLMSTVLYCSTNKLSYYKNLLNIVLALFIKCWRFKTKHDPFLTVVYRRKTVE